MDAHGHFGRDYANPEAIAALRAKVARAATIGHLFGGAATDRPAKKGRPRVRSPSPRSPRAAPSAAVLYRRPSLEISSPRTLAHLGLPSTQYAAPIRRDNYVPGSSSPAARGPPTSAAAAAPSSAFLSELWQRRGKAPEVFGPRLPSYPPAAADAAPLSPREAQPAWLSKLARDVEERHRPPPPHPELVELHRELALQEAAWRPGGSPQPSPRRNPRKLMGPTAEADAYDAAAAEREALAEEAEHAPPVFAASRLPPTQSDFVMARMHAHEKASYAVAAAEEEEAARRRAEEYMWEREAEARAERAAARERSFAQEAPRRRRMQRQASLRMEIEHQAAEAHQHEHEPAAAAPAAVAPAASPEQIPDRPRTFGGSGVGEGVDALENLARHHEAVSEAREAREKAEELEKVAKVKEARAVAAAARVETALAAAKGGEVSAGRAWALKKAPKEAELAAKEAEAAKAAAEAALAEAADIELSALECHYNPNVRLLKQSDALQKLSALDAYVEEQHKKLLEHSKLIGHLDSHSKGRETAEHLQRRRHTLTVDTKAALSALTRKAPDFGAPSGSFKARWQRGQAVASLASTPIKSIRSPRVRAAEKATVSV